LLLVGLASFVARTRLEFDGGHLILRGADFESLGS